MPSTDLERAERILQEGLREIAETLPERILHQGFREIAAALHHTVRRQEARSR